MLGYTKRTSYTLHYAILRCCWDPINKTLLFWICLPRHPRYNIWWYGTLMVFYVCLLSFACGWLLWLNLLDHFLFNLNVHWLSLVFGLIVYYAKTLYNTIFHKCNLHIQIGIWIEILECLQIAYRFDMFSFTLGVVGQGNNVEVV